MKYPKPIMTIKELKELGYSEYLLKQAAHHSLAYKYIIRNNDKGKIRFDTAAFEKVRNIVWR